MERSVLGNDEKLGNGRNVGGKPLREDIDEDKKGPVGLNILTGVAWYACDNCGIIYSYHHGRVRSYDKEVNSDRKYCSNECYKQGELS